MIGWLILAVYLIGYVKAVPRMARAIAADFCDVDATDQFMSLFLAMIAALIWPILLIITKVRTRVFKEN